MSALISVIDGGAAVHSAVDALAVSVINALLIRSPRPTCSHAAVDVVPIISPMKELSSVAVLPRSTTAALLVCPHCQRLALRMACDAAANLQRGGRVTSGARAPRASAPAKLPGAPPGPRLPERRGSEQGAPRAPPPRSLPCGPQGAPVALASARRLPLAHRARAAQLQRLHSPGQRSPNCPSTDRRRKEPRSEPPSTQGLRRRPTDAKRSSPSPRAEPIHRSEPR